MRPAVARRRGWPRRWRLLGFRTQLRRGRRWWPRPRHRRRWAQDPRRWPISGCLLLSCMNVCICRFILTIGNCLCLRCGRARHPSLLARIQRCLLVRAVCSVALAGPGVSILCVPLTTMTRVLRARRRVLRSAAHVSLCCALAPLRPRFFQATNALFTFLVTGPNTDVSKVMSACCNIGYTICIDAIAFYHPP